MQAFLNIFTKFYITIILFLEIWSEIMRLITIMLF